MWGWGKGKIVPAQVKLIEATKAYVEEAAKPVRFYGYYNSLCQIGRAPWPPVLRDNASYDRADLYQLIADALNVKHRYSFLRKHMDDAVAAYDRGDKSKMQLADDMIKMLRVIKKDEKDEAPMFEEHERMLANYERRNGNWGG